MILKDYYSILGLSPTATATEIRQAYRRLVMETHPDKNPDDPYAAARFREIKEAYDVLSHPRKKENYLQQRWYQQSTGHRPVGEIATPVTILKQALELEKYVSKLDIHRLDQESLMTYCGEILSAENMDVLKHYPDPDIDKQIIRCMLHVNDLLDRDKADANYQSLLSLAQQMPESRADILQHQQDHIRNRRRESLQPFWMILLALALAIFLWQMSR